MAGKVTIYHNPRCSKSRKTLELIQARGVAPTVVEYLNDPPSAETIGRLIDLLGIDPHALLRAKEPPYETLGLSKESSREAIIEAIANHPILMERPVVATEDGAVLGRPPENVLELL